MHKARTEHLSAARGVKRSKAICRLRLHGAAGEGRQMGRGSFIISSSLELCHRARKIFSRRQFASGNSIPPTNPQLIKQIVIFNDPDKCESLNRRGLTFGVVSSFAASFAPMMSLFECHATILRPFSGIHSRC